MWRELQTANHILSFPFFLVYQSLRNILWQSLLVQLVALSKFIFVLFSNHCVRACLCSHACVRCVFLGMLTCVETWDAVLRLEMGKFPKNNLFVGLALFPHSLVRLLYIKLEKAWELKVVVESLIHWQTIS